MFNRANWIGLGLVSVMVSAIVAMYSTGKDEAVAQVLSATPNTATTACARCPWSFKYVVPTGSGIVMQVFPPGTSGFLHGVRTYNGSMEIYAGPDLSYPQIGTILATSEQTVVEDFDVRFTNGLSVRTFGGAVTFLYMLDTP